MTTSEINSWLPLVSIVVAGVPAVWAAVQFILSQQAQRRSERYKQFYEIAKILTSDGSIVAKIAAAYELRKYPEYKDVIIRICEGVEVVGDNKMTKLLRDEFRLTAQYLKSK